MQLQEDMVIERYSPLKETLIHFCKRLGYTVVNIDKKLSEGIRPEMSNILSDTGDVSAPYNDIEDVDDIELEKIRERICYQQASAIDKLRLKKQYFRRTFDSDR